MKRGRGINLKRFSRGVCTPLDAPVITLLGWERLVTSNLLQQLEGRLTEFESPLL